MMTEFILSLLNSFIYDATTGACVNWFGCWKKKRFEKKLQTEVKDFCKKNENTYIGSEDFQIFLKYHRPLERIMQNAIAGENSNEREQLFDNLLAEAVKSASDIERILSIDDKRMLRSLYSLVDENIRQYYRKMLSEQQRYIVSCNTKTSQSLRNHIDKVAQGQIEELKVIKSMIAECEQLSDYKAKSIANLISKKMWEGDFEELEQIAPVIKDRSRDLSYMLESIELVYFVKNTDLETLKHQISMINNPEVRNCAIKSILPILYFRNQSVGWLKNYALGKNLKNIILAIEENDFSFIFTEKIEEINRIEMYKFVVNKQLLNDEPVLSKMIVVVYLYNMKSVNTAQFMEEFWGEESIAWFIWLLIANRKIDVLQYNSLENSNKDRIKQIRENFVNQNNTYSKLAIDFQTLFYSMLFKASLYASDGTDDLEKLIPKDLLHEKEIEDLIIESKIKENNVSTEEVLEYCKKTGEYWLLTNYIISTGKSEKAVEIIESHIKLISLVPDIFFIYVEGLMFIGKEKQAKALLQEYERKYGTYFDYWNLCLNINKTEESKVLFIQKCKEGHLTFLNRYAEYIIIERLIDLKECDLANEYIKRLEMQIGETSRIKKYKASILQNENKNVDALEIYKSIFDDYSNDPQVIGAIIWLSINMKRIVDEKYIEAANALKTPRMYLLAAAAYAASGNIIDARRNNIRAILASDDYQNPAFMQYLGMNLGNSDDKNSDLVCVEKDSAVYLRAENGCARIYCIYADKLLPSSPFIWDGDIHLYVEDVAKLGIYKQPVGTTVEIEDVCYKIESIESIDAYFVHHCFDNVVKNGSAQAIMSPVIDGKLDVDSFVKQIKDITGDDKDRNKWIRQYCDFEDVAMPLFSIYKFYNVTYTQFVETILKDPSICIREVMLSSDEKSKPYMLSFTSLIILIKAGVPSEYINREATYITESTRLQINNDIADMIERYSQEHVMSLGIYDGQPYTIQTEEDEKQMWMKEAGVLKDYADKIRTVLNTTDLSGGIFDETDITELFGIPDYDAIAISVNQNYTLVSTEATLSSLKNTEDVKLDVITITDWLLHCEMPWRELLPIIKKIVGMGSITALNVSMINFLLKEYELCSEEEKNEMLALVHDILEVYVNMHARFKAQATQVLTTTYAMVVNQQEGLEQNELMRLCARYLMRLHNIRFGVNKLDDGRFELVAYKLDEGIKEKR